MLIRRMRWTALFLGVVVSATSLQAPQVPGSRATAAAVIASTPSTPCATVETVWARGSGQGLKDAQWTRWTGQLAERIKAPVTVHTYELGEASQDGHRYPAVDVSNVWNGNALGAKVSGGYGFDYGNSVLEGVKEYASYLIQRAADCPDALFVAGGFSQGAQVIGETYYALPPAFRDRIVFNALFGDPKLYLPEGEGIWPAACRGKNLSPWRRRIANCEVDNGSLGARKPYLPAGYVDTTGLWCADKDFVCGSSKNPLTTSGHNYAQPGGDIDSAVQEIAERLRSRLPAQADSFDVAVHVIGTGTTGLDVVFVIDSTGSMSGVIEDAKQFAASMASTIRALRGRAAVVEYRDAGDDFVARTLVGLTSDVDAFNAALSPIYASGGGDTPEAALTALMQAFDSLDWRAGATKAAVILTDASYHDPDVATGVTTSQVAARSREIDPVNVYPVVPPGIDSAYLDLAAATSGQVIVNNGDAQAALEQTFDRLANRPVALLAAPSYFAEPGQEVRFDASDSYATEGSIDHYRWDFDGDGTFDAETVSPVADHVYANEFDGTAVVEVTDSAGLIGSASATVLVSSTPPALTPDAPKPPTGLTAAPDVPVGTNREVALTWTSDLPAPPKWAIGVNGVVLGTVSGDRRTITVTDVPTSADVEFSVAGVNDAGDVSDPAKVTVAALPTVGSERPLISLQAVTHTARPTLGWSTRPGVTGYELAYRESYPTLGGYSIWLQDPQFDFPPAQTSKTGAEISRGVTRCYRVRWLFATGPSDWSRSACTTRPLDDRQLNRVGRWHNVSGKALYEATASASRSKSAALRFRGAFAGRVAVVFERCLRCGRVKVYVGRHLLGAVSTRPVVGAPTIGTVWIPAAMWAGKRTIVLRPAGHRRVVVDGLVIEPMGG